MIFRDRKEAGRLLAKKLLSYEVENPVVFAIPRGGVIVAYEVAKELNCPLTLVIPRKIGAPYNPELAIGAIAPDGQMILNEELVKSLEVSEDFLQKESEKQVKESERRQRVYGVQEFENLQGKTAIVVDDGIATGYTALAAVRYLETKKPEKVILAVPVAPPETVNWLKREVDEVVVLDTPVWFSAVGQFYENFEQVSDEEVLAVLKEFTRGS